MWGRRLLGLLLMLVIVAAACGDDDSASDSGGEETSSDAEADSGDAAGDDDSSDAAADDDSETEASEAAGSEDAASGGAAGGGESVLVFDGEEIALSSRGCYTEEQEVAGSIITLTAQASGTNAAGEDVVVDFSRYAPGSAVIEGDDILIDIGPLGASTSYQATLPFETATIDGGVLTVPEASYMSFDDGSEVTASVTMAC